MRYGYGRVDELRAAARQAFYNAIRFNIAAPCTNCYITDMVPSLVYKGDANHADGTVANLNTDAMMHHFVMINPGRPDPVCPGGLQGSSVSASSPRATSAARCTCPLRSAT